MPLTRDEDIYALLANARTMAMVGASDRPDRASNGVMRFLQGHGYRVIPINPQSWVFEAATAPSPDPVGEVADLCAQDQLDLFLSWSLRRGIVDEREIDLLLTLADDDRSNPAITRWMRGACSMSAVARAASERGVCAKSVTRARDRTT